MNTTAKDFFTDLCNKGFERFGTLFETKDNSYFYDSGTGKVFACELLESELLSSLIKTSNLQSLDNLPYSNLEITNALQELFELSSMEHILQLPHYNKFICNGENENTLSQIIFEVTQRCNLRCKYCIFNDDYDTYRTFSESDMTWEIAKKGIDYAMDKSGDKISIGFYGGEPLLNFNLIKKCIDYCTITYTKKQINYSITSNLTLVNEEIALYLSSIENLSILCSIDGPNELHNLYRIFGNGSGSFEKTMNGFYLLKNKLGERSKHVLSINSVVCPPYTDKKLFEMKNFFENETIFPSGMNCRYSYVSYGSLKDDFSMSEELLKPEIFYYQNLEEVNPIKCWSLNNLIDNNNVTYEKSLERFDLIRMQNRYLVDKPSQVAGRNGCCNPGYERLYITVDGKFKICEKIGESPYIGDVENGLDIDTIEHNYIHEYDSQSLYKCNDCWAIHLCDLCYCTCYTSTGIDIQKKEQMCFATRSSIKNRLIEYYQLLESKPELIDELSNTELTAVTN